MGQQDSPPITCPECRKPSTVKLSMQDIEIDHCRLCSGTWFDSSELESILESPDSSFQVPTDSNPSRLTCPRCVESLHRFSVPSTCIEIDMCPSCNGIWLQDQEFKWMTSGNTGRAIQQHLAANPHRIVPEQISFLGRLAGLFNASPTA